jgi:hypothetical protein
MSLQVFQRNMLPTSSRLIRQAPRYTTTQNHKREKGQGHSWANRKLEIFFFTATTVRNVYEM